MPVDHDRDEVDPTGIRDLLAGLPDPGPMPEHLVRRIEARLEVEQAARHQSSPHSLGRQADRVVDLATERSRRRPGRTLAWVGAAAAGLVVTAAVVPQLVDGMGSGDAGTAAYYPTRDEADTMSDAGAMADVDSEAGDDAGGGDEDRAEPDEPQSLSSTGQDLEAEGDSADTAAEDEAAEDGAAEDGAGEPASPALPLLPLDGELVLLPELGLLDQEDLTELLLRAVDEQDATPTPAPVLSGLLTEGEATSCWRDLASSHSFDRYAAARAQVVLPDGQRQGDPVVALLGLDPDGSARSWVMPEDCIVDPDVQPILEGDPRP